MIADYSQRLIMQEGSPRDGLQIEPAWVPTADKIALIDGLSQACLSRVEVGSFVCSKFSKALSVYPYR